MNDALGDALQKLSTARSEKGSTADNSGGASRLQPSRAFPLQLRFVQPAHLHAVEPPQFINCSSTTITENASSTETSLVTEPDAITETRARRESLSPESVTADPETTKWVSAVEEPVGSDTEIANVGSTSIPAPDRPEHTVSGLNSVVTVEDLTAKAVAVEAVAVGTAEPAVVAPQHSFQAVPFVSRHRRQIAAAVVIICMMALWMDDQAGLNRQASSGDEASSSEEGFEDTLLSEFDSVSAEPLREPAEPVEESGIHGSDLTIPVSPSSDGSLHAFTGEPAYKTAGGTSGSQTGRHEFPETSSERADEKLPESAGSVRFTGRIAPLN